MKKVLSVAYKYCAQRQSRKLKIHLFLIGHELIIYTFENVWELKRPLEITACPRKSYGLSNLDNIIPLDI